MPLGEDSSALDPVTARRTAWLEERRGGIGGSDAAAAVGLSPYKTPYQLYLEKRGEVEPEDLSNNERVEWGIRLEDAVAEGYMARTGWRVHRVNKIQRHPHLPFMLANLDRRIVGAKRGLEIKTVDDLAAKFGEWGPTGTDLVPTTYHLQVMHYYAVTGYEEFDVAALVGGNELRIYHIPRDESVIADLVKLEGLFWEGVEAGIPPDVKSVADARMRFPKSVTSPIEATTEIVDDLALLAALNANAKQNEQNIDAVKGRICGFMGEHDELTFAGKKLATWKTSERKGHFVKPTTVRTFRTSKGD